MDTLITEIGKQGLLGTILALSLVALFTLVKMLLNEKDKRIQDAQQVRDSIASPLEHIRDSLNLIEQKVTISKRAEQDDR